MTPKKKPECSCFICSLNPWLLRLLLVLPFAGVGLGTVGVFTDVGGTDGPKSAATITVTDFPRGIFVTFTPVPTPTVEGAAGVSPPVRVREIVREIAPAASPIVVVETVIVERLIPIPVLPAPTAVPTATVETRATAAPTAVPTCKLPPGLCRREGR